MRIILLPLLACALFAQLAPSVSSTYTPPSNAGDTQYFTWTSASTRAGNWNGGAIIGQYNDGFGFGCNGGPGHNEVCIFEITAYNKTIPSVTTSPINAMSSYPDATGCYDGVNGIYTRKPFAFNGVLFLEISCNDTSLYLPYQSGLIVSPDGGAHWCNYKTFNAHIITPGCDSSNWQANGDNPVDINGFQWPITDGSNKFAFVLLVDFMCQDQAINCPNATGVDPSYLYFMGLPRAQTSLYLARVAKSGGWQAVMNPANWQAYASGSWTSTLQSATSVSANMSGASGVLYEGLGSGSFSYLKDFGLFIALAHYGVNNNQSWATAVYPWGPWTDQSTFTWSGNAPTFTNLIPGLCPKYDVAGRITCTVSGTDQTGYSWRISEWNMGPFPALFPLPSPVGR